MALGHITNGVSQVSVIGLALFNINTNNNNIINVHVYDTILYSVLY